MGEDDRGGERDDALWAAYTRSLRPLSGRDEKRVFSWPSWRLTVTPAAHRRREAGAVPPPLSFSLPTLAPARAAPSPLTPLRSDTMPGLDGGTTRRLRQGRLAVESRLDLHGLRFEQAQAAVRQFLAAALSQGRRCVLVITGKSGGRLQEALTQCLNEPPVRSVVLAFTPAQPWDGGAGAFYILLRRQRETSRSQRGAPLK